ncbi:SpoVR family protein [Bermanella marisrubri]|uniref:SpoVR n=1 Tax=Bermanella marisrubri TaxID=207949 RepID=Q1N3S5_9GAMM|nr:SpoVR family protein [Bermanella marisrubri]EAT12799.1 SpoVR [Oceanobacter sp. RED65] [Bermanella marisrubri]QIZ83122.1 SpoVR family protein [Bermanella marisrubri]
MTAAKKSAKKKPYEPISQGSDWNFDLLREYDSHIARIAEGYRLDTYPNQIEVITAEQMMDAYASVGMPISYHHWSYGKQFLQTQTHYQRGQMGLAYEIVINSDPCIAYLMEENTITMQALVIAHACYGHNSFFKGNYLFRTWTDASAIIDYLVFARQYIKECEERHGVDAVEDVLDAAHALMNYGVDRYKRPRPISAHEEKERQKNREDILQQQVNDLWRTIPGKEKVKEEKERRYPQEPQENLLYFLEKNAPLLRPWQREVIRIVRKLAQYFYPQRQTQVMNEGWATFWHYTLLNTMYDEGLVSDGFIMEFLNSHTNVVYQPPYDSPYYSGINPYALGFSMFTDIRRICENPTEEDRRWFPDIAGSDWLDTVHFAMQNFKDESFVLQYLSPKVMRDMRLFSIMDDERKMHIQIDAIHDDEGYHQVRENLARQYDLSYREPNIQVYKVDVEGDRSLTLHHYRQDNVPLGDDSNEVLKHLRRLWGFDVYLHSIDDQGKVAKTYSCTNDKEKPYDVDIQLDLSVP